MRYALLTLLAIIGINLSAQTNIQYQAHVPFQAASVSFSAYIADSGFNENSRLNTDAFWYIENQVVDVNNGIINVLLQNVADTIFLQNKGNIFVFAYVNGQPLGRLPFNQLPYALHANVSARALRADAAGRAENARNANHADTAEYAKRSGRAASADSANHATTSDFSTRSDVSLYAAASGHSVKSDTAKYAILSGRSIIANSVDTNGVSTFSIRNGAVVAEKLAQPAVFSANIAPLSVQRSHIANNAIEYNNIEGGSGAQPGSYLMRGTNGLVWETNPQHRTGSVAVYTSAPAQLPSDSRWVVSRVAVDYNLAAVASATTGQLVTIYNGSTANTVTLDAVTWNIDTAMNAVIQPGQSRTLWFNGTKWVVVQ